MNDKDKIIAYDLAQGQERAKLDYQVGKAPNLTPATLTIQNPIPTKITVPTSDGKEICLPYKSEQNPISTLGDYIQDLEQKLIEMERLLKSIPDIVEGMTYPEFGDLDDYGKNGLPIGCQEWLALRKEIEALNNATEDGE